MYFKKGVSAFGGQSCRSPRTRSPEALLALAPSAAYSPGAEETRPRPSQRPEAPGSRRRSDTPLPPWQQGKALHRRVSGEGRGGLGAVWEDPQRQRFSILKTTHLRGFNNKHKKERERKARKAGCQAERDGCNDTQRGHVLRRHRGRCGVTSKDPSLVVNYAVKLSAH